MPMLERIATKLMSIRTLGIFFIVWLIVTLLASAISLYLADPYEDVEDTTPKSVASGQAATSTQVSVLPERLIIEKLDKDLKVINPQTTDLNVLDKEMMHGVVRYPESGTLGEGGKNIVIFGHSARIPGYYGAYRNFNDIETLVEGDTIVLQSSGKEYVYRVSRVYKKDANTDDLALDTSNNKLTIVTCDGFGKRSDRWIVESDFLGSYDL